MTSAEELIARAIAAKETFCKLCGTKFIRNTPQQIFCKHKCAEKWHNGHGRPNAE